MFVENGDEEENTWENNLVVYVRASFSLRTTDYTPAGFFILNLLNKYNQNRVAGSEGHGFWMDM